MTDLLLVYLTLSVLPDITAVDQVPEVESKAELWCAQHHACAHSVFVIYVTGDWALVRPWRRALRPTRQFAARGLLCSWTVCAPGVA